MPLAADGLFFLSLTTPALFRTIGALDAAGRGTARFVIPNLPALAGFRLHASLLTFGAPRVDADRTIAPPIAVRLQR